MRLVIDDGRTERELLVEVETGDATVADLLAAADVEPTDWVTIAGRVVPTDHTIAEAAVPEGATIVLGRAPAAPPALDRPRPTHRVAVVAGTTAGHAVDLDHAVVVGRDAECDLVVASATVSGRHCRVVDDGRGGVVVTDLGSTNGTWVDGRRVPARGGRRVPPGAVVRCGAVALRIEELPDDTRPRSVDPLRALGPAGTVPFNRPPRPGPPPPTAEVRLPLPAPGERESPRFNLVAVVAPLVIGAVMVRATGSWLYGLFMLLSPVMLVANMVGDRRRSGREHRRATATHREDVARFVDELVAVRTAETDRRWAVTPSIAETRRRGTAPSVRLWERRRTAPDQLVLGAGIGSVPFRPDLAADPQGGTEPSPLARDVLEAADRLPDAPVEVDLSRGGVVGIVGDRTAGLALARSLVVQAAVHHGPADLAVAVVTDQRALGAWGWAQWLPHVAGDGPGAAPRLAVGPDPGRRLLRSLLEAEQEAAEQRRVAGGPPVERPDPDERPDRRTTLLVVDAPALLRGRDAPARAVLRGGAGPVAGIVVARSEDELPAVCDTVVTCGSADGDARLLRPAERLLVPDLLVAGLAEPDARAMARRLAGFEDPELTAGGGGLPARVDLLSLLPLEDGVTPAAVASLWSSTRGAPSVGTPIGVGPDAPLVLDMSTDGPHGLLGGTTGSGKSELLRSLVAGLAARHDPDHLTFVLVDYKGGAAFDACADLPHVVGLVTDLDEHLGERALRCLEAELEHRERRLRAHGVQDLPAWLRLAASDRVEPLPRLLVVVDEFATLRAELPDFVSSLVGVAQRGRSLGVHLLLGTQRPSGAVDENVRANSNLRIALRMTDAGDSTDVVGVPDAAAIPPSLPGRGVVRIGPGAVVPVQTALVTGRSRRRAEVPVRVAPLRPGHTTAAGDAGGDDDGPTDLQRLVDAATAAFAASDSPRPRRPWPAPLPDVVPVTGLADAIAVAPVPDRHDHRDGPGAAPAGDRADSAAGGAVGGPAEGAAGGVVGGPADGAADGPAAGVADPAHVAPEVTIGVVDLPDQQARGPATWRLDGGPLLVHGVVGSGTTTTLATAVVQACRTLSPDALHVQVLDLGRGGLAPLATLPHVGAVVAGRQEERRRRLLDQWLSVADRRRAMTASELAREAWLVVAVDGLDQLLAELDDPATFEVGDALVRLLAESAALRIAPVVTTARVSGLRGQLTAAVEQRLTHRLASPDEYALLGLRPGAVPALGPGRAVRVGDGRELQVAWPGDLAATVASVAGSWPTPPSRPAPPVRVLPPSVTPDEVAAALAVPTTGAWVLPVGRRDRDLGVATVALHRGEHALLLGAPQSGRSGVLGAVARVVRDAGTRVVACAGTVSSPLLADGLEVVAPDRLGSLLAEVRDADDDRCVLVVVDDAERVPDPGSALDALTGDGPRVHVVAAARDAVLQSDYGHWLRRLARADVGAFLRPLGGTHGDLLGARLPSRPPAAVTAGRGWLVSPGVVDFVQFATLDADAP